MVITKHSRAGSNRENLISEFETGCLGLNKMTLYEFNIGSATVELKKKKHSVLAPNPSLSRSAMWAVVHR